MSVTEGQADFSPIEPGKIRIFDSASLQEVSPAVKGLATGDRLRFRFRKDGRIAFGVLDQRTWNLTPDNRPFGDLAKLGQLYSGRRRDATGGISPLGKQEREALWRELSGRYPEEFTVRPEAAVEWRMEQILSAWKMKRSDLGAFHRRWLADELVEAGWQPGERGNEDMERYRYVLRLQSLAAHGSHAQAVAAADAVAARWPKDHNTLYDRACVFALAAGAVQGDVALSDRYAARAVALLRQAVAAGYRNGPHIRRDPDLNALRRRKDFLDLLRDLTDSFRATGAVH